jgi:cell pole-organizing protein PopZ
VIGQADEQWEPDGTSEDALSGTEVETIAWEDHDGTFDEPALDDAAQSEPADSGVFSTAPIEGEAVEAPAFAGAEAQPAAEAVQSAAEAETGAEPETFEMQPDAFAAEELAAGAVAEEAIETLAADETVMDEETLRELVADIVRQELQGALGERITRNVRKLVRRENHRALAAQDLG